MTDQEIRNEVIRLSGAGKRAPYNRAKIYSSFYIPLLQDIEAVRDTERRLDEFKTEFAGKTVLDVGSNVGAIGFEIVRRGAKSYLGYEFNIERVELCRAIAARIEETRMNFTQIDLRTERPEAFTFDIVCCFCVDDYIEDVEEFYGWIYRRTKEVCLFETNIQGYGSETDFERRMTNVGFKMEFIGAGHSGGISRKRHCYRLTK